MELEGSSKLQSHRYVEHPRARYVQLLRGFHAEKRWWFARRRRLAAGGSRHRRCTLTELQADAPRVAQHDQPRAVAKGFVARHRRACLL